MKRSIRLATREGNGFSGILAFRHPALSEPNVCSASVRILFKLLAFFAQHHAPSFVMFCFIVMAGRRDSIEIKHFTTTSSMKRERRSDRATGRRSDRAKEERAGTMRDLLLSLSLFLSISLSLLPLLRVLGVLRGSIFLRSIAHEASGSGSRSRRETTLLRFFVGPAPRPRRPHSLENRMQSAKERCQMVYGV